VTKITLIPPLQWTLWMAVFLQLCLLAGCSASEEVERSLGVAYVGAMRLELYAELQPQPEVTGELGLGEEVELLRRRRNFFYVRGPAGQQGWTHRSGLFNEAQANEVKALAELAAEAPSQGEARVYAKLNVHNHPNRAAPTIFQLQEDDLVAMIAHERHPRGPYDPGPLFAPTTRRDVDKADSDAREALLFPYPEPPPAWLRLSGVPAARLRELAEAGVVDGYHRAPVAVDGDLWTLVRKADGMAGWALTARLAPAIPDRVAQYAEGARIMAYFSLGPEERQPQSQHWVWVTQSRSDLAHDFDSFRVFVWNLRLGRYETALIQRGVEGYLPVERVADSEGNPRFRLMVRERTGVIHQKTYELAGMRTRLVENVPWPNREPLTEAPIMERLLTQRQQPRVLPERSPGFWERVILSPVRLWDRMTSN
jgi:hypothetical protein